MKVRDGYKMTELGEIPQEWEVKKIEDISERVCVGFVGTCNKYYCDESSGIPMIRTTNLSENGILFEDLKYVSYEFHQKNRKSQLRPGDILVARHGENGKACIFDKDIEANCLNVVIIRPEQERNYSSYIKEVLNSDITRNQVEIRLVGSVQNVINTKTIADLKLSIPPIAEQQRIAEILSSNDALIAKTDELIEKTKEIKAGLMQELLTKGIGHTEFKDSELGRIPRGWEVKKLGEVVNKIIGGGTPAREVPEYFVGNIPWVTVKDLDGAVYKDSAIEYISNEAVKNSSTNVIEPFNVIVATRMGLGRGFINKVPMAINQDLKALIPLSNINCLYLLFWFLSNEVLIASMGTGSTVKGIRLEALRELLIPVPSIEEQRNIASILMNINGKLEALTKRKQQLEEIKKGLMQDLLTGRVRVV